jgi:hypothetical protein
LIWADWPFLRAPRGFSLTKPKALLLEWAGNCRFSRREARQCHSLSTVADVKAARREHCASSGLRYALTSMDSRADPAQVSLDLAGYRGRGLEVIDIFLKEFIEPTWSHEKTTLA